MKFGHIELFVKDPEQSKTFYQDVLGFEVTVVQDDQFVWLKSGDVEILLRPGQNESHAHDYAQAASGLVLYTSDVGAARTALEARGLEFKGTDGSDSCLTFTDPDGHWFQLVNPDAH